MAQTYRGPEERLWAGAAHLSYLAPGGLGLLIAFAIYLIQRERSYFVAAHARQAIGFQLVVMVLFWILSALGAAVAGPMAFLSRGASFSSPGFFAMVAGIVFLVFGVLAIIAAVHAFTGRTYRYPVIGEWIPDY